jgi:TldD protein
MSKYKNAILMDKAYLGGVDPNLGNYYVRGTGFIVKDGERQNIICNLKISGNVTKNLFTFEYIGNDLEMSWSYCVKLGQCVRVGLGGPTVSLSDISAEGDVYETK